MDIQAAIYRRRTIQIFNTRKVPEEFLERAIEAANQAPCHRLTFPWRFTSIEKKKRDLIAQLAQEMKFSGRVIDEASKEKFHAKYLNPSNLLIASQISTNDPKVKLEDYAACACAIQNLLLSLVGDGVGSKWSTGKITTDRRTYKIVGINPIEEEIIGFIWVGYGQTPAQVKRPLIKSIYRRE